MAYDVMSPFRRNRTGEIRPQGREFMLEFEASEAEAEAFWVETRREIASQVNPDMGVPGRSNCPRRCASKWAYTRLEDEREANARAASDRRSWGEVRVEREAYTCRVCGLLHSG